MRSGSLPAAFASINPARKTPHCGPPTISACGRIWSSAVRLASRELATLAGHNTLVGPRFFDVGRGASDHEFVGDAAYIHLEIEALHRRARDMPGQTARTGAAADDFVSQQRMNVEDRIDPGHGHVRPAEAERRPA